LEAVEVGTLPAADEGLGAIVKVSKQVERDGKRREVVELVVVWGRVRVIVFRVLVVFRIFIVVARWD
jgi:hypothetical protein